MKSIGMCLTIVMLITLTPILTLSESSASDGRFITRDNGIVLDTNTGLEWLAGPDRDTNWHEARTWVDSLAEAGSGWRMPTKRELQVLYANRPVSRNMTPLLQTTGEFVWTSELESEGVSAWGWRPYAGFAFWLHRSSSDGNRGFAVRSRR